MSARRILLTQASCEAEAWSASEVGGAWLELIWEVGGAKTMISDGAFSCSIDEEVVSIG